MAAAAAMPIFFAGCSLLAACSSSRDEDVGTLVRGDGASKVYMYAMRGACLFFIWEVPAATRGATEFSVEAEGERWVTAGGS